MDAEKAGLAAVVKRATTRCRCGRFGVRESGFCSADCAASAPAPAPVAVKPTVSGPAAAPHLAAPIAMANDDDEELAALVSRMVALDSGQAPVAAPASSDPEEAAFLKRMKSYEVAS